MRLSPTTAASLARASALSALVVGLAALGGCATKDFVREQVGVVDGRVTGVEGKLTATQAQVAASQQTLQAHGQRLDQLDRATKEALDRANAAGKLAEGKFAYSMVMSDDSATFKSSKSSLSKDEEAALTAFATKLKADNRNVYVEIQGHTDSRGSAAANLRLGAARAEAVRRFLNTQGVALNRMSTISYGAEQPAASNKTRAGRAKNRRVVLVVLA